MRMSLAQAAVATGRSRSTILRTIRAGRLSAERDEVTGAWSIDMAELTRVFPLATEGGQGDHDHPHGHDQPRTEEMVTRLATAEARLADAQEQIADLRRRLDQADADRRQALDRLAAAQERVTALLTDQRPVPVPARRKWWPWR